MARVPFVVCLCVACIASCVQAQHRLPAEVARDLKEIERSLEPVTVEGRATRMLSSGTDAARLGFQPASLPVFMADTEFTLRLAGSKLRLEQERRAGGQVTLPLAIYIFDGSLLYLEERGRTDADGAPSPTHTIRAPTQLDAGYDLSPAYLTAAGLSAGAGTTLAEGGGAESLILHMIDAGATVIETRHTDDGLVQVVLEHVDSKLASQAARDPDEYEAHLRGGRNSEEHIQRELAVFREAQQADPRRRTTFTLDPAMGSAVVAWETRVLESGLTRQSTNSDFVQIRPGGPWLPRSTTTRFFTTPAHPSGIADRALYTETIAVSTIAGIPLDNVYFEPRLDVPGMMVSDFVHFDQPIAYLVPAQPEQLEEVIREIVSEMQVKRGEALRESSLPTSWLLSAGAGAALLVLLLWRVHAKGGTK